MTLPPHIELRARCAGADDISGIIFACRSPLAPRTHTASSSPRRWRPHSTRSKRDRDAVHRSLGHGAHGLQRLPAGSERSRDYPPLGSTFVSPAHRRRSSVATFVVREDPLEVTTRVVRLHGFMPETTSSRLAVFRYVCPKPCFFMFHFVPLSLPKRPNQALQRTAGRSDV